MVQVKFVDPDGKIQESSAPEGLSIMEVALLNGINGIQSVCGGICSCCLCHCFIKEPWSNRMPQPEDSEAAALEGLPDGTAESRLGCQVLLSQQLDGLVVHLVPGNGA